MPKQDVRMSSDEVDRFLRSQHQAMVVAGPAPGAPRGAVGTFRYDDGGVVFAVRDDDPVVEQLRADDRACCVVETFPSYYEITGVMVHGHARRRAGDNPGAATFDLDVVKTVSFDFGKLARDQS